MAETKIVKTAEEICYTNLWNELIRLRTIECMLARILRANVMTVDDVAAYNKIGVYPL